MSVHVPRQVWESLAVLHGHLAGQAIGNLGDINAVCATLQAENARLRSRLCPDVVETNGSCTTGETNGSCTHEAAAFGSGGANSDGSSSSAYQKLANKDQKLILPPPSKPGNVVGREFSEVVENNVEPIVVRQAKISISPRSSKAETEKSLLEFQDPHPMMRGTSPMYGLYEVWQAYVDIDQAVDTCKSPYTQSQSVSRVSLREDDSLPRLNARLTTKYPKRTELNSFSGLAPVRMFSRVKTVSPDSRFRLSWDFATLFILAYDCVLVPLQLFDPPGHVVLDAIALFSACYWSLDMCASTVTGFYRSGQLVMDFPRILRHYLMTWFAFDLFIVTLDWITLLMSVANSAGTVRMVKLLRFVRLLKLLRLFKLEALFQKQCERSNVGLRLVLIVRFLGYIFVVLMFTHLLACIWYAIGNDNARGWVDGFKDNDFWYLYFSSMHWALTCFHGSSDLHPTTTAERIFTVLILVCALFSVTWLQSTMTQMMIQMHTLSKIEVEQTEDLLKFFRERRVTASLSQCIRAQIMQQRKHVFTLENNVALLKTLPRGLMMDLRAEITVPLLILHTFFSHLRDEFPRAIRQICHAAVQDYMTYQRETFFVTGDACGEMYVVDQGVLEYIKSNSEEGSQSTLLTHGLFACEGSLWMKWNNSGHLLAGNGHCLVYKVVSAQFREVLPAHAQAHAVACQYARDFLARVEEVGYDDIMNTNTSLNEKVRDKKSIWSMRRSVAETIINSA